MDNGQNLIHLKIVDFSVHFRSSTQSISQHAYFCSCVYASMRSMSPIGLVSVLCLHC